jgi:hypothetical protein
MQPAGLRCINAGIHIYVILVVSVVVVVVVANLIAASKQLPEQQVQLLLHCGTILEAENDKKQIILIKIIKENKKQDLLPLPI